MTINRLLFSFLAALTTFTAIPAFAAEAKKPNVIFILADDLGWTDLACFGSKYYETPNIDKLAAQGMRFTNAYSCAPNCTPTRTALMTGQYEPRTGIYTVGNIKRFDWESRPLRPVDNVQNLPSEKVTVANAMKSAGYATAMFGKWHLGNNGEFHPTKRGFDEGIVAAGRHFNFVTVPPVEYPKGQYLADFLTDRAVDFIRRKKDGPFFLYLPHFGVHAPHEAKPELIAKFKAKPGVGGHNDPTYAAMIYSVDESVGRILATLDELGIADNTLVIFASDNGGVGGYARAGIKIGKEITDNAPLRGGKGMLYEGGVRVPFIFRWPGKIRPGMTCDEPIISVDLFPTFAKLAGATVPATQPLDGVDLMPVLTGGGKTKLDRDAIYWHFPGYLGASGDSWRTLPGGAIRMGDYKLIEYFEDNRIELYDLKNDIGQAHDLAATDPQRAKTMHEKLVAWRKATSAQMPTPNTPKAGDEGKKKRKRNRASDDE